MLNKSITIFLLVQRPVHSDEVLVLTHLLYLVLYVKNLIKCVSSKITDLC